MIKRIPFTEWLPDQPDIANGGFSGCNNAVPADNGYRDGYGWDNIERFAISGTADNTIKGLFSTRDGEGEGRIFWGTNYELFETYYQYSVSSATSANVSRTAGYTSSGENYNQFWDFEVFGDLVIATNGKEEIQSRTASSSLNKFQALVSGETIVAKTVAASQNFLLAGNVVDSDGTSRSRVRWSALGNALDWTVSATTQADYNDLESKGGQIIKMVGGEYALIFQERAVYRMTYVGSPLVWQFDEILGGFGTDYGKSVVRVGSDVYYYCNNGFRVIANGSQSLPIGEGKVDRYVRAFSPEIYKNWVIGAHDPRNNRIIWTFNGGTVCYDYVRGKFGEVGDPTAGQIYHVATAYYTNNTDITNFPDGVVCIGLENTDPGPFPFLGALYTDNTGSSTSGPSSKVTTGKIELSPDRNALVTGITLGRERRSSSTSTITVAAVGFDAPHHVTGSTSSETVTGTSDSIVRRFSVRKRGRAHEISVEWNDNSGDITSYIDIHYAESHRR